MAVEKHTVVARVGKNSVKDDKREKLNERIRLKTQMEKVSWWKFGVGAIVVRKTFYSLQVRRVQFKHRTVFYPK